MSFGNNRTSREFLFEAPFKLSDMIFHISVYGCDFYQLDWVYFANQFNVHWPALFVDAMVKLWVVF